MNTRVAANFDDMKAEGAGFDHEELARPRQGSSVDKVIKSVQNFATLSEALRILGASVLLASMSVFLLQGWNEGNDISRYLLLLAQTGLLAAAGFAMSHGLKEAKGARLFFGLALVSIPANFTILGALLYSVFQWDGGLTSYPAYATWQIENVASTGVTLGGALLVLIPVTFFCFAVMARHSAKSLSLHFLLLNLLLLLPIRGSIAAGSVALLGVLYALYVVGRMSGKDRALKTGEGKFALTALFIPLGIILFRSMYFYQVDSLMIAMVSLAFYLSARQAALFPGRNDRLATVLDLLSLPLALAVAIALTDASGAILADAAKAPFFAVVYTALALDLMRRTASRVLTGFVSVTISFFVALSFIFSVAVWPGAATALLGLAAGTILILAGAGMRDRVALLSGVLTMFAGVYFGFDDILRLVVTSGWIELAVFGASAIALGSVLDRHGVALKLRAVKWFNAMGEKQRQTALED
ncbi:MAG: hypothetical protein AAGE85_01175 [Pseudomonadota bacterium]